MELKIAIKECIGSGFSGIWLTTKEVEDAVADVAAACKEQGWYLIHWDPDQGYRSDKFASPPATEENPFPAHNPVAALKVLLEYPAEAEETRAVLVLRNAVPYFATRDGAIGSPMLLQWLQKAIERGSETGHHVIILSDEANTIPPELEKMVYPLDHALPDQDELWKIASKIDEENMPERKSKEAKRLLDAANGLTRLEALGAFSQSMARHRAIKPEVVWELKAKTMQKGGLVEVRQPKNGFDALGGLVQLKQFCLNSLLNSDDAKAAPLGVLLVGLPGTGKSAIVDAIGYETDLPVIDVNMGNLKGGLVGDTERKTRLAIKQITQMRPCVLRMEEIEKMFRSGGGSNDGGAGEAQFGMWLTFLAERPPGIYIVGSCNDISRLMNASSGAFGRAERFDAIFFLDLPSKEQRDIIWNIHKKFYEIVDNDLPDDEGWTGAEIKSCCRLARLHKRSLKSAAELVVPVSVTAKETIKAQREWATKRCLSADYAGLFNKDATNLKLLKESELTSRPKRKVTRGISAT